MKRQSNLTEALKQSERYKLLILDACRYDYFKLLYDNYFVGDLQKVWSAGFNTFQYMREVWPGANPDVTYISAASPVNSLVGPDFDTHIGEGGKLYYGYVPREHLGKIVDVWRYARDEEMDTTYPIEVNKAALEHLSDKMVIHYFQPHEPHIGDFRHYPSLRQRGSHLPPLPKLELRGGYVSNLKLVLQRAKELVAEFIRRGHRENIVLSSDHGELLGEDDLAFHQCSHQKTRLIPWFTVHDLRDHTLEIPTEGAMDQKACIDQLFSEDRFTLIVLDAMRYDYFKTYNTIPGTLKKALSPATHTYVWFQRVLTDEYPDVRVFSQCPSLNARGITPNKWIPRVNRDTFDASTEHKWVSTDHFQGEHITEIGWDGNEKNLSKATGDISALGNKNIVWYLFPHRPYLGGGATERQQYEHTVKRTVAEVERFLEAFKDEMNDMRVVVTSDHGEVFEPPEVFGLELPDQDVLHHAPGVEDSRLQVVPWLEVEG